MEKTIWKSPTDICSDSTSAGRQRRRRTFLPLVACSAAVVLASCSAEPAEPAESTEAGSAGSSVSSTPSADPATEPATAPTPSTATTPRGSAALPEPLSPANRSYPPEELVLSEKGTGGGRYVIEEGLKEGERITVALTCTPGDKLTVKADSPVVGISNFECGNGPLDMNGRDAAVVAAPELEITVETSNGGSFWIQARVYDE